MTRRYPIVCESAVHDISNKGTDLAAARLELEINGGWLLDLGPAHAPVYYVTDDSGTVHDLRGQAFLDRCEHLQIWDETLLPAE